MLYCYCLARAKKREDVFLVLESLKRKAKQIVTFHYYMYAFNFNEKLIQSILFFEIKSAFRNISEANKMKN